MIILAIDPGTTHSGVVRYDTDNKQVLNADEAAIVSRWVDAICAIYESQEYLPVERVLVMRQTVDEHFKAILNGKEKAQ